jgi:predicted RNA-binding protein associated with RNAse of E/G family
MIDYSRLAARLTAGAVTPADLDQAAEIVRSAAIAHRAGYDLAAKSARDFGLHLVRYEVEMERQKQAAQRRD